MQATDVSHANLIDKKEKKFYTPTQGYTKLQNVAGGPGIKTGA